MNAKWIYWTSLALACPLAGCIFQSDKEAKRGTVVDNEVKVGRILLAGGGGAPNAEVKVYPVDYAPGDTSVSHSGSPDSPAFVTHTDGDGYYRIGAVPAGKYNVLGQLDGTYMYRDSLGIPDTTLSLPYDTLGIPGALSGMVGLQPNHDPRTVFVQVLGTYHFSNVDSLGRFRLNDLAAGSYSLRIATTLAEYTPLYLSVRIEPGKTLALPDTLWLPFTGIPVVTGLHASFDTAQGIVRLAWQPAAYRDLEAYFIYRKASSSLDAGTSVLGKTADTLYFDTLSSGPEGWKEERYEYRVRILTRSEALGLGYEKAALTAASRDSVQSKIRFHLLQAAWDSASQSDSVEVRAETENPTRGQMKIVWSVKGGGFPGKAEALGGGMRESAVFGFRWSKPGVYTVIAEVEDAAGSVWRDSLLVRGNSPPLIFGEPDSLAQANRPYTFIPAATDPDDDPLIFSAVNLPAWASLDPKTGALTGTPGNADSGVSAVIRITVSDGTRETALPAFRIRVVVNPWLFPASSPAASFPAGGMSNGPYGLAIIRRDIYLVGGFADQGQSVYRFDIAAKELGKLPDRLPGVFFPSTQSVMNRLYVIYQGEYPLYPTRIIVYDPASGSWDQPSSTLPVSLQGDIIRSLDLEGKLYVIGNESDGPRTGIMNVYDDSSGKWMPKASHPAFHIGTSVIGWGGKIYTFGGGNSMTYEVYVYDPHADAWSSLPDMPIRRSHAAVCGNADGIFLFGGYASISGERRWSSLLEHFDPVTGVWSRKNDMPFTAASNSCVEDGGKFYLMGAERADYYNPGRTQLMEYDPTLEP